jgi:hypothetical protein
MPEINMNISEQADFTPSNPDKKKQEFTPGKCFVINGRKYIVIDKSTLEALSGELPNALAEDGKLYNFNEVKKIQPGALYYDQERNKYFLRVNLDSSGTDDEGKEFNAVESNSGALVYIDPKQEREPDNNDWPQRH